jgi:hypothetical protein
MHDPGFLVPRPSILDPGLASQENKGQKVKNHKMTFLAFFIFSAILFSACPDLFGDQFQIVLKRQRSASDFGMKEFSEVIFIDGSPKVIVDSNRRKIAFLDDLGKMHGQRTLLENERFVLSKNAKFIGTEGIQENGAIYFFVENRRRELLWQDMIRSSRILISNTGDGVIVVGSRLDDAQSRGLDFYDNIGTLVRHLDTEVIKSVEISPQGDKLYLATVDSISAYDIQGNQLWQHSTRGGSIVLSDNGEFVFNVQVVAETEESSIEIYHRRGLLLGVLQFPSRCTLLAISSDGKFAAVEEKNKLLLYELENRRLKWVYDLAKDPIPGFKAMGLSAADVGADAQLTAIVVTAGKKVGPGPDEYEFSRYIRILDWEGRKICERFLVRKGGRLQVKLSPRGRAITVWTRDEIYSLRIERR